MEKSKKVIIVVIVIGIIIFGYSQYVLVSQIEVSVIKSDLIEKTEQFSSYNVHLKFKNPSLLILTAGETDFFVMVDGETVGEGNLDPFVLPIMSEKDVSGTFQTDPDTETHEGSIVKISGITKYDVLFSTVDVPFVFYPNEEQAREFIHQN